MMTKETILNELDEALEAVEQETRLQMKQPVGLIGRFKCRVRDAKSKNVIHERDWQTNIFTNHGLDKIAKDIPYAEAMVCCALSTDTTDVRFPEFVLEADASTAINQRTGNSVVIPNTTVVVSVGDTLSYRDTKESFYVITKVVGGGTTTLTLLNPDNSAPTGTTAANAPYFIYHTSKKQFTVEVKRCGTRSGTGSTPAAGSDPDTDGGKGFITGETQGPTTSGQDGAVSVTLTAGAVTSTAINNPGINYLDQAPPILVCSGGGAGQLIVGQVTGAQNDSGQLLAAGTGYSNTPGDVTLEVFGAGGALAQFTVNVSGGEIQSVDIDAAGDGFFSSVYSTAAGTLRIKDSTGAGSGGSIVLTPRRQATLEASVSGGAITVVRILDAGYKLTGAPIVQVFSTSYEIHERVFSFTEEVGTQNYRKIGVSWNSGAGGADLTAMMALRNASTGAADPLQVLAGQQAEVTYQLIVNFAPTTPTYRNSSKIGGFWRQDGTDRNEGFGTSIVLPDGSTFWKDNTYFGNEPFFYDQSQLVYFQTGFNDAFVSSRLQFFISENNAAHTGSWGTITPRGVSVDNATASVKTPVVSYINDDSAIAPFKVTKKAVFSLGNGNTVDPIKSFGLGYRDAATGNVTRELYSYVFSAATIAQNASGRPRKDSDHRITLEIDIFLGRRLAV